MSTYERKMWKLLSLPGPISTAAGSLSGILQERISGINTRSDLDTDPEDIVEYGGIYQGFPTTGIPEKVKVRSDSSEDEPGGPPGPPGGDGAWTIQLDGLDGDFNRQSEVVTMNGTSPVNTTNFWSRIHRCRVLTAGDAGENVGNITVIGNGQPFNKYIDMTFGRNSSSMAIYTIPAGYVGYLTNLTITAASGSQADVADKYRILLKARPHGGVFESLDAVTLASGSSYTGTAYDAERFEEKTDIKVHLERTFVNRTTVAANFIIYLIEKGTDI